MKKAELKPAGTCLKCGSDDVKLIYCNANIYFAHRHNCPECEDHKEHMTHVCQRCFYEWYSPTLDSNK